MHQVIPVAKYPMLTVCIPTYDRYDCLVNTLESLRRQVGCDFEVVVVDQTPVERRRELESAGLELHWLVQEAPSASAARNIALGKAQGQITLFLDDDVIINDPRFLARHEIHYRDPRVVGVAGAAPELGQAMNPLRHRFFREGGIGWAYFPSNQSCQAWLCVGRSNNLSVRTAAAIGCGGMDEQFERGAHREEADFGLRLTADGRRILYDPYASLVHIGNAQGGIRSWQQGDTIKALHHMVGDLYLLRIGIRWSLWPEYVLLSLRYFVFTRGALTPPRHSARALARWCNAWRIAGRKKRDGRKLGFTPCGDLLAS